MAPAYADGGAMDVLLWKKHGGSVTQTNDPNGRIRRTFISPSGEKFRSWKECLKYIGSVAHNKSVDITEVEEKKISKICLKEDQQKELSKCLKEEKVVDCKIGKEEKAVSDCKSNQEMVSDGKVGDEKLKRRVSQRFSKEAVENVISHSKDKSCSKEIEQSGKSDKTSTPSKETEKNGNLNKKDETSVQNGKLDKGKTPSKEVENSGKSGKKDETLVQNGKSDKQKTPSKEKEQNEKSDEKSGTSVQNGHSDKKKTPLKSKKQKGKSDNKDETSVQNGKGNKQEEENGSDPTVALANFSSKKRCGSQSEKKTQIVDKRPRRASSSVEDKNTEIDDDDDDDDNDNDDQGVTDKIEIADCVKGESNESERRRPKRAAASTCFKEKRFKLDEKDALIEAKPKKVAQGEEVAIVLTAGKVHEPEQPPKRRLLDFVVHDEDGKPAALEMVGMVSLYVTGLILPNTGDVDKESGVLCEGIPIEAWDIAGYEEGQAKVWLTSGMAEYLCIKPLGSYKRTYEQLFEKALVCVEIYKLLSKPDGGDPELGFEDLFAKLSRTFGTKGYQFFSKEYLVSKGSFIVSQLEGLDKDADGKDQLFSGLPALMALDKECKSRDAIVSVLSGSSKGTSIKIRDEGSSVTESNNDISSDEKLARLLQEQEERKMNGRNRRNQQPNKGKFYIKINEDEIAMDYPSPAYYKAEEEEMDEYVLFDENSSLPEDLPRRMLHDWALYNCDSRLVSLELLPMLPGTETDVEVFGSGIMTDDDGGGYVLDDNSSSGISSTNEQASYAGGIRIYLSSIKEWMIEFGASLLFISIRTDGAWYRLGQPSPQYAKWYAPVLKTSRIAIHIITMLKDAMRVSRLSFGDVIKRLAECDSSLATYISSRVVDVERYIVVHGQIILQQFAEYPDETIKRSAFISGLASKMEERHHVKLLTSKKKLIKKGQNLNPRAGLRPDGTRPKPMRATTTKLINRIWSEFYSSKVVPDGESNALEVEVVDQDEALEDGSDNDEETIVISSSKKKSCVKQMKSNQEKRQPAISWVNKSVGKTAAQELVYAKAIVRSEEVSVGGAVLLDTEEQNEEAEMIMVEYMYEKKNGTKWIHGRFFERGQQTVLGDAASPLAVFLTDRCTDIELADIKGSIVVQMIRCGWNHASRKANAEEDEAMREKAKERKEKGLPPEYYCRALYSPDKGSFSSIPFDKLALGTGTCHACDLQNEYDEKMTLRVENDEYVRFQGIEHHIKDFLYVSPDVLPSLGDENEPVEKFKSSRNRGLRAFVVCQLLSFKVKKNTTKHVLPKDVLLSVRRFFRPEDISPEKAYNADVRELYFSETMAEVTLDAVCGKCEVLSHSSIQDAPVYESFNHIFFCSCIYDPKKGTIKQLPANIKLSSLKSSANKGKSIVDEVAIAKRKGKAIETEEPVEKQAYPKALPSLASLDIFAGCGGLSEGLHQSGAAMTKWAIEYEHPAAEAFKLNHPEADVFCENCNVILRSIMEKGGDLEDCMSTPEAEELSLKFSEEQKAKLPQPGEVDLIVGGPPCQGFSGMNRFNQSTWSKVQCEMILSFLSFADYFRPRYFLLENVRNFVSFNKGQTFRLALASLLEMGYQVRFGVLQAGNYGVSQSRKRAFIWAASPEDTLPEWPEPRHVFASSQLDIVLPGNLQYSAVRNAATGAPFRPITVRDTIADLPPVGNGADKTEISYGEPPQSWFQKLIRGPEKLLYDHIAKEMNELNYIRCQRIPKRPGADWRDLPEEKIKLSTGQLVDLIPWCLPNTAERHNQWKGLFGRLDWEGNFPTSVTDPQPMGKVGMCFHPEQDRIVTVRECARSQGFPDSYKFFGTIQSKHRQIGNAVPPPLARALGEKLKAAAECSRQSC